MMLRKCVRCGAYSLRAACRCGGKTASPHPPKFSVADRYARYRRMAKENKP